MTCGARNRKPVHAISDRAKRYRANTPECRPRGPKRCEYCGSNKNIDIHHRDGDESNGARKNLAYACRSCNVSITNAMKARGKGVRTRQFNPEGATTMAQWVSAVLAMKGENSDISKADAIEIVHATPADARSRFAREIWRRRRRNPAELIIFGNPKRMWIIRWADGGYSMTFASKGPANRYLKRSKKSGEVIQAKPGMFNPQNAGIGNHKPGCACAFCKNAKEKILNAKTTPKATRRGAGRAAKNARSHRRNPDESSQAVKLFESFHGKSPKEIIEAQRSSVMREDYTALGTLIALGFDGGGFSESALVNKWEKCPNISFQGDHVKLASSPNGRQLYLIGGNQNLDAALNDFEGVDPRKDLIDLGDVFFVVYLARKVHSNFEPTEWVHRFGAKTDSLPRLVYDKLKKEITLVGGEYFIDTKAGVSPGIEG